MGFLDRLLGRDWGATLERAEELLARGEEVRALDLARRAARRADGEAGERAAALVERARRALVESVLAKAEAAEAEGHWEDAADWLLSAIEHSDDGEPRNELEARREELLERAEEARSPFVDASPASGEREPGTEAEDGSGDADEMAWAALVDMLDEEVRPRYADRPEAFRRAVVALNEGRSEARESLEELAEADPADPVLRFERGRARLLAGEAAAALEDLDAAWQALGDRPLDAAGSLSPPALWGEAALEAGEAEAAAERLEPIADPAAGDAELVHAYAGALIATGRRDAARRHLRRTLRHFPRDPRFPLALAGVLAEAGEPGEGIALLEAAVAPSCAGGGCGRPAKHPPSLRTLARLHLGHGSAERARELLALVAQAQGGRLTAPDYDLLAGYYRGEGDERSAERAAAEADRLRDHHEPASVPPPEIGVGKRRVL